MTKSTVPTELKKAYREFAKLRNNLKRADLDFTVQFSLSSTEPTTVYYAAQMTAPADGLAPIRIVTTDYEKLVEAIKVAAKDIDQTALEIAYHQEQMAACDRTKIGHEERIAELKGETEEETTTTAEESK